MAQTTTYTCDNCGHTSTYNTDWVRIGPSTYNQKDYCPSCVRQLITTGAEANRNKVAKANTTQTTMSSVVS